MRHRFLVTMMLGATIVSSAAQKSGEAEAQFQAALHKEQVEGDLRSAIQLYRKIADSKAASRATAAQALLQMGQCYEKLGGAEARKAYERIVEQYSDQADVARQARSRLAANGTAPHRTGELATRLLWRFSETSAPTLGEDAATDGHTLYHIETGVALRMHALTATDLASGQTHTLLKTRSWPYGVHLSPNRRQLALLLYDFFGTRKWTFQVMNTDGSGARVVFTADTRPKTVMHRLEGWSPDGTELLFSTAAGASPGQPRDFQFKLLSLKDGSVRVWKYVGAETFYSTASGAVFSPDGRFIAYGVAVPKNPWKREIHVLRRGSSEPVVAVEAGGNAVLGWTPDGSQLLFASDRRGSIDAYRIAMANGKPVGVPVLVKAGLGKVRRLGFGANGEFYYVADGLTRAVMTDTVDLRTGRMSGRPRVITQRSVEYVFLPKWSPDGNTLVYATTPAGPFRTPPVLVFRNAITGEERQVPLSTSEHPIRNLRMLSEWSPDSRFLYLDAFAADGEELTYRIDSRSGEVKAVVPGICTLPLADGRGLLCVEPSQRSLSFSIFDFAAGSKRPIPSHVQESLGIGAYSPDVSMIAYSPFAGASARIIRLADGSDRELLKAKSGELLYPIAWANRDTVLVRRIHDPDNVTYSLVNINGGAPVQLHGTDLSRVLNSTAAAHISFHPDGKQVVFVSDEGKNELWALENVVPARAVAARK